MTTQDRDAREAHERPHYPQGQPMGTAEAEAWAAGLTAQVGQQRRTAMESRPWSIRRMLEDPISTEERALHAARRREEEAEARGAKTARSIYIQYLRPDGLATYAMVHLTTDHPRSSYGLPVVVVTSAMRTDDPLQAGMVLGSADLPGPLEISGHVTVDDTDADIWRAALAAGYKVIVTEE